MKEYFDQQNFRDAVADLMEALSEVDTDEFGVGDISFGKRQVDDRGWYWSFAVTKSIESRTSKSARSASRPSTKSYLFKRALQVAEEAKARVETAQQI